MPPKHKSQIPSVLSQREFFSCLRALGGEPCDVGNHPKGFRFHTPSGMLTIPLSDYPEYHRDFFMRVFLHELGLTKSQVLQLLNGKPVVLHGRPGPSTPVSGF